ncbi:hypothetical protein Pmar_PMAR017160 [Perkinsus marinus ATCC 50983]|uniref:DAAF9 N-terminal domain-containing protein n=1 Tax=Perkinsus marinus (strain ATCC 50983 / TXsc) TaxID=423536 RepID=C5LSR1_PERM5|nr:hypothetical protein Pmar_PMAR017160 [Perkinsus marinus ATCC 50983]EER00302.1 hypothetical protein Pmar_PMAR017160 [Perkinsus marinus ATCC 50983]|eukprot:XP_002767584.1 hypothetical protein Pmar_PMAR017160 [Perkinsus marinus ATCC 50983]
MILKMISSLAWSAGTVLNGSEFSERADELSELFIVVSGKEGMYYILPGNHGVENQQCNPLVAFDIVFGEKPNANGLKMSLEKWPLVKAYGYEGFATPGFLTLSRNVTDISELLRREVLSNWTPAAASRAAQGHPMKELETAWNQSIAAVTRMDGRGSVVLEELGKPLIELYDYGQTGDDEIGSARARRLVPGSWVGTETLALREGFGGVGDYKEGRGGYMVWKGVHPETRIACARTYLLPSHDTSDDDMEEIESMTMEAIRLVRDAAGAIGNGEGSAAGVKVDWIDAFGSTSERRPEGAEITCAFISFRDGGEDVIAVTTDRMPQLTPLSWSCSRSQIREKCAVEDDAARFLSEHRGVRMGRLLLNMAGKTMNNKETSSDESRATKSLGELEFAPPDVTSRSRIGLWKCHASKRSLLARVGITYGKMNIYSNGFALCGDGSRVLLVKIDNESSLCLIDGIGTGGPWLTMSMEGQYLLVFELVRPSLQSTDEPDDYLSSPSRVLQLLRERGISIGVKDIGDLPIEVARFLRSGKSGEQPLVEANLCRRFTLPPCAELSSPRGVVFVAGLPGSEGSTQRLAKSLAGYLGASCLHLPYHIAVTEWQEGTIRHPLVARLIRLCSAVVVPDRNTANKFERLIHYDLSKICGKVHLLPIGPDRPRDVADVLKESPTMECLYLPMERAELSYPRPQSTLEIELEVGLRQLCQSLGLGRFGRYLDPEYRWPLPEGTILLSVVVRGVLCDDDNVPADALLDMVRAGAWTRWSYPIAESLLEEEGGHGPTMRGRFLAPHGSTARASDIGKAFMALVVRECLPSILPREAHLTDSVVPADVREAILEATVGKELPNGWFYDGTFYLDMNSGRRSKLHPEMSARLASYVAARQTEVDAHNVAVITLRRAAIVN